MLFYAYTPALAVIIVLFIGAVPSAVALRQTETVNSDHLASSKFLKLAPIGAMFMAVLYHLTPAFARETFYPYKKSMFFWSVLMFGTGLKPERIQTETEAGKMAKCVVISLIRAAPVIVMSEMGRPLGLCIHCLDVERQGPDEDDFGGGEAPIRQNRFRTSRGRSRTRRQRRDSTGRGRRANLRNLFVGIERIYFHTLRTSSSVRGLWRTVESRR